MDQNLDMTSRRFLSQALGGSHVDLDRMISTVQAGVSDEGIAAHAHVLAYSGEVLEQRDDYADVASTGGPSSLSTLLCPLYLHALGWRVAKLGVPGRPAGGVDVLATVPGFSPELDRETVEAGLRDHGHVHVCAGGGWAPLDAALFRRRQQLGAQQVPELVIASLLAKKIAMGVKSAGVDVRVAPHGNFGSDTAGAHINTSRFVSVAGILGIHAVGFLTDGSMPYQGYLGRGESLLALAAVIADRANGDLARHARDCFIMAAATVGAEDTPMPTAPRLRAALGACLEAHGTTLASFDRRVEMLAATPRFPRRATHGGFVTYDLDRLRQLLVVRQSAGSGERFADPAGVVLTIPTGSRVSRGDVVVSIRVPDGEQDFADQLAACVHVGDEAGARAPSAVLGVVSDSTGPCGSSSRK
jgi:pyrimidine-nucleoside phosphorylase